MASQWNSLQVATLAVAAVTPLTVAAVGYYFARASQRLEHVQWANQTVITRRLEIFGQQIEVERQSRQRVANFVSKPAGKLRNLCILGAQPPRDLQFARVGHGIPRFRLFRLTQSRGRGHLRRSGLRGSIGD